MSHHFIADRPIDAVFAVGRLRISYQLAAVADGTRFQRDLDYPDLGPRIAAEMEAQSRAGMASLAALVERHIPAWQPRTPRIVRR